MYIFNKILLVAKQFVVRNKIAIFICFYFAIFLAFFFFFFFDITKTKVVRFIVIKIVLTVKM